MRQSYVFCGISFFSAIWFNTPRQGIYACQTNLFFGPGVLNHTFALLVGGNVDL